MKTEMAKTWYKADNLCWQGSCLGMGLGQGEGQEKGEVLVQDKEQKLSVRRAVKRPPKEGKDCYSTLSARELDVPLAGFWLGLVWVWLPGMAS